MRRAYALLATVFFAMACYHQTGKPSGFGSLRNVITQDEIDSANVSNVYDLVARLRGDYLKDRGKLSIKTDKRDVAMVFLNDQEYGVLETMRNIPCNRVSEIRYYSGIDAVNRYGAKYGGGVVLLVSRTQ
jgi:hypothetical protein